MAQAGGDQPQPGPLAGGVDQDLRDGQADQFGVADARRAAAPWWRVEQIVDEDVQCDDEVVETGAHEALPAEG